MKLNRLHKILIIILSILLVFTFIFNVIKLNSPFKGLIDNGYGFFSMIRYALVDKPINTINDITTSISELYSVKEENKILREHIEEIAMLQAYNEELSKEIKELKELNSLNMLTTEFSSINATVMNRSHESYNNLMSINVGLNDGVKINSAVITSYGLIGKIIKTYDDYSIVKLLTNEDGNNKVSVKIAINQDESADAILEYYDANSQNYVLTLLSANTTITKGMKVTSSGLGGVFPNGILVGTVDEVIDIPNALSMKIMVKPSAKFNDIDYVKVLVKE